MPVAILSALGAKIQTLVDSATDLERADIGTWPVWSGVIDGRDVILAKAGLGKVNTAALAGIIWDATTPIRCSSPVWPETRPEPRHR